MEEKLKFQVEHDNSSDVKIPATPEKPAPLPKAVVVMGILMTCLAIMMIAGFVYLHQRLSSTHSSKTHAVNTLSQNLEDRFSSLSVKQARLEAALGEQKKTITQKLTEMETVNQKKELEIEAQFTATEKTLAGKIGPKELQKTIDAVEKKLGTLDADLSDMVDQLDRQHEQSEAVAASVTGQLTEFENILNETAKNVIDLKTSLADIANRQMDKKAIGGEIKRQLSTTNNKIAQFNAATEAITGRLQSLQKRVASLDQNSDIYEREILKLRSQMNDLQRQLNARPLATEKLP